MPKAEQLAQTLGEIKPDQAWLEAEISRLNQKTVMPLKQVSKLHDWLDAKRKARKSCRIIGESGTGKTVSCQSYVYRHRPIQEYGQRPIVPVAYVFLSTRCGLKDFFEKIIEVLKHRATKGTTSELRGRTREILKACHVEMLIIDEAQRLKPETFDDARDLGEELGLSVVLVGTDRLDAAIGRDRQVKRRFQACHRFGKLDADDFETTVNLWEAQVLKLPVASNLTQKEVLTKLTAATGGYIAQLDDILREAAIQSLLAGFKRIEIPVLERVIKDYE